MRVFTVIVFPLKNITKTGICNLPYRITCALKVISCKNCRHIDMPLGHFLNPENMGKKL